MQHLQWISNCHMFDYIRTVIWYVYLSHIQQEVENALEELCNLLPSSIASTVGALDLNDYLSIIISSISLLVS